MPGRNSGFLLIITGWGASGKVILQVSIVVFAGIVEKFSGNFQPLEQESLAIAKTTA